MAVSPLQKVLDLFGPGSMAGEESAARASIEQGAASRGLSGTTMPVAMSVGMGQQLEGIRKNRLAEALTNLANLMQQQQQFEASLGQQQKQFESSLKQRQEEMKPGAQWAPTVSPAAVEHQQGVLGGMGGAKITSYGWGH